MINQKLKQTAWELKQELDAFPASNAWITGIIWGVFFFFGTFLILVIDPDAEKCRVPILVLLNSWGLEASWIVSPNSFEFSTHLYCCLVIPLMIVSGILMIRPWNILQKVGLHRDKLALRQIEDDGIVGVIGSKLVDFTSLNIHPAEKKASKVFAYEVLVSGLLRKGYAVELNYHQSLPVDTDDASTALRKWVDGAERLCSQRPARQKRILRILGTPPVLLLLFYALAIAYFAHIR